MKIMIVDDDRMTLRALQIILERWGGHSCCTFNNPNEALHSYADGKFDLVITDLHMPELSGFELLHTVLATDPTSKVVMMSGLPDQADYAKAKLWGAAALLEKPIEINLLLDTIAEIS